MIYAPAEDSFLLEEEIIKYLSKLSNTEIKKIKVLDMGSGSGIQAEACIKNGINKKNIVLVDIQREVIDFLKSKDLKTIQSNLFLNINNKIKYDLIIFNPPYLPEDKYDNNLDTTAGKEGYEIIMEFLKQAKDYLSKRGTILLLFSNLSKENKIIKYSKNLYQSKKLAEKEVGMFEKLYVYSFQSKN